jgi:glycosyltransferase involved in cell wall biosynthesis
MIRIFINGLAASAGAGLTYLHNVVPHLSGLPGVHTTLAVQPGLCQHFERLSNVDLICPLEISGTARRFIFEQTKLAQLIEKSRADVLISAGNFAMRKPPIPQILLSGNSLYTSADFSRDLRLRREYAMLADNFVKGVLARRSVHWADQTVVPSQAFADELQRWAGKEVAVIHHGFDRTAFFADQTPLADEVQEKLWQAQGCLRLLFVSHYNYYRNFETLLQALPLIQNLIPHKPVKLFLTCKLERGANPGTYDGSSAFRLVQKLGIANDIVQLGAVPYASLHHLYRACDLYVTPAYAETFAHPLVEAMASGLPVVASDLRVHKEVCGEAAQYFPRFSPESLAKTVAEVCNPDLRSKLVIAAKIRAADFSWSKHVDNLLNATFQLRQDARVVSSNSKSLRSSNPLLANKHTVNLFLYAVFVFVLALGCYLRPMPDDFDRYIYEAVVRSQRQPIQEVYRIVKHENPRAESSSVLDSPEHLAQLEPMYAIRPLYIGAVSIVARLTPRPQNAINIVSAASLFVCAILLGLATRNYFCSALLMLAPGIVAAGRMGTPDCLSAMTVLAAYLALVRNKVTPVVLFLVISVWIRTDNILFVMTALAWLAWNGKLKAIYGSALALVSIASVECINIYSGNYGWRILFHYSFIGGKYPAEITPQIGISAYVHIAVTNAVSLAPQIAPWLLLGLAAWRLRSSESEGLIPILIASILHFALFPSAEGRYFVWVYFLTGLIFIRAMSFRIKLDASISDRSLSRFPSRAA